MTILVTGGGGGIGRAVVELALERGHDVIAHDLDDAALSGLRGAATLAGDLTDAAHLAFLEEHVANIGLDAVIGAHGIAGAVALRDVTAQRARTVLTVNGSTVPALFRATRSALLRSGGAFVAVSSQASLRAEREQAVYCASKWAVTGWGRAMAARGTAEPIVRVFCPGRTDTPLFRKTTETIAAAQGLTVEEYTREISDLVPLRRFASTRESAALALFLATQPRGAAPTVVANSGGEVPH